MPADELVERLLTQLGETRLAPKQARDEYDSFYGTEEAAKVTEEECATLAAEILAPWRPASAEEFASGIIPALARLKPVDRLRWLVAVEESHYARRRRAELIADENRQSGSRRGGLARKRCWAIQISTYWKLLEWKGRKPTAKQLFKSFPEHEGEEVTTPPDGVYEVYRTTESRKVRGKAGQSEVELLVQVRLSDDKTRSITFSRFQDYVTQARSLIKSVTQIDV